MVQKSGDHQLRLVVYPIVHRVWNTSKRWYLFTFTISPKAGTSTWRSRHRRGGLEGSLEEWLRLCSTYPLPLELPPTKEYIHFSPKSWQQKLLTHGWLSWGLFLSGWTFKCKTSFLLSLLRRMVTKDPPNYIEPCIPCYYSNSGAPERRSSSDYPPEVQHSPWKMMVGRLVSFWNGIFSGAMLNFQGVYD